MLRDEGAHLDDWGRSCLLSVVMAGLALRSRHSPSPLGQIDR